MDVTAACDWPVGKSASVIGNQVVKQMVDHQIIKEKAIIAMFYDAAKTIGSHVASVSNTYRRRTVDHLVRRAVRSNLQCERGDISDGSNSSGSDTDEVDDVHDDIKDIEVKAKRQK
jgi:hypothetical protein